jgi:hypothetical protein
MLKMELITTCAVHQSSKSTELPLNTYMFGEVLAIEDRRPLFLLFLTVLLPSK